MLHACLVPFVPFREGVTSPFVRSFVRPSVNQSVLKCGSDIRGGRSDFENLPGLHGRDGLKLRACEPPREPALSHALTHSSSLPARFAALARSFARTNES